MIIVMDTDKKLQQALARCSEAVRQLGSVFEAMAERNKVINAKLDRLIAEIRANNAELSGIRGDTRRFMLKKCLPVVTGRCEDVNEDVGKAPTVLYVPYESSLDVIANTSGIEALDDSSEKPGMLCCLRERMPGVTPGEVLEFEGQRVMVTEIDRELVYFEPVKPEED